MDLSKIISISGKPGLYLVMNQTRGGVLAKSLVDGKKIPISQTQRVSTLADISIYLEDGDEPLTDVFREIYKSNEGAPIDIDIKDNDALRGFLREILPEHDEDRVYASDIRKLVKWYNLLLAEGLIDLEEEPEEETEENAAGKDGETDANTDNSDDSENETDK